MLSDLDIGMNDWVCPRFKWDDSYRPNRGRVLTAAELEKMARFHRYANENADSRRGAHAARRALEGRVLHARLRPQQVRRLHRDPGRVPGGHGSPAAQAPRRREAVPEPAIRMQTDATFGIISVGGCDPAVREAVSVLAERGIVADYMRIRAFPFGETVEKFLASHDRIFVVEQNRDAQLKSLLTLETACRRTSCIRSWSTAGSRCRAATWSTASPANWSGASPCRRRNQRSPTRTCSPTRSASRCATTRGRRRRCARAAATIRSPPPSCAPSTSSTRRRT